MFHPNFDEQPSRESSRFDKLAFVVGDPTEARSDREDPRPARRDEEAEWMSDRLTACYND